MLVNAGLVQLGEPPAPSAQAPWVIADDVAFSLSFEEP